MKYIREITAETQNIYSRMSIISLMSGTITVNGKSMEWYKGMSLFDVYRRLGYTLKIPPVLVQVNGRLIRKSFWKEYTVPEGAVLQVVNVFRGG